MKTKFALAIASVILVVSLIVNSYSYWQQSTFRKYNSLQNQVASLQGQLANLSNQTNSFQSENSHLHDEKANLQSQLSKLSQGEPRPPKLVTRLGASDMRYNYSGQDIRLYITGEVWNVGTEAAQNCSLHVTFYQGDNVAEDSCIQLGTIEGGSFTDVARNIYYTGDALTNWTIIPEFA